MCVAVSTVLASMVTDTVGAAGSHGEGPDARTPLPHHLGGAVGVGVAAEADKENFARPTPRVCPHVCSR